MGTIKIISIAAPAASTVSVAARVNSAGAGPGSHDADLGWTTSAPRDCSFLILSSGKIKTMNGTARENCQMDARK